MRLLHLYRPRLPGLRAQTIQVLHTTHALARAGHEVTVIADRSGPDANLEDALKQLGLKPHPRLKIQLNPYQHNMWAGIWYRRQTLKWWKGPPGVVLARDKKRLIEAMRFYSGRHKIILECHALDSAVAEEKGESGKRWEKIERYLAEHCHGLISNCGGVMHLWAEKYTLPKHTKIIHNATRINTPGDWEPQRSLRCIGSWKDYKGVDILKELARSIDRPVEFFGASVQDIQANEKERIQLRPQASYDDVQKIIHGARALLLPLNKDLFGTKLTSPLKLWDYLASPVPIIAPDLPTIHEIQSMTDAELHFFIPGDLEDLISAVNTALKAPPRQPHYRTWLQRAIEVDAFIKEVNA